MNGRPPDPPPGQVQPGEVSAPYWSAAAMDVRLGHGARRPVALMLSLIVILLIMICAAGLWLLMAPSGPGGAMSDGHRQASDRMPGIIEMPAAPTPAPAVKPVEYLDTSPEEARRRNLEQPLSTIPNPPAAPFRLTGDIASRNRAATCLAAASWYEAGDDTLGSAAVIQVILNRVRHPAFPASVCGVVFQGAERRTGCQFTFTCDGSLGRRRPSQAAWSRAIAAADAALSGYVFGPVGSATHYHADYVQPTWAPRMDKVAMDHFHLFYRWKGFWGRPDRLTQGHDDAEIIDSRIASLQPGQKFDGGNDGGKPSRETAAALPATVAEQQALPDIAPHSVRHYDELLNIYLVLFDMRAFPGSYAVAAWTLCKDKPNCRVTGWWSPNDIPARISLSQSWRVRPIFRYESGSGSPAVAQWDCARIPRRVTEQCLPVETVSQ